MHPETVRETLARVRCVIGGDGGEPHRIVGVTRSERWRQLAGHNAAELADMVISALDGLEKELTR